MTFIWNAWRTGRFDSFPVNSSETLKIRAG